jgi:hypothetical protein
MSYKNKQFRFKLISYFYFLKVNFDFKSIVIPFFIFVLGVDFAKAEIIPTLLTHDQRKSMIPYFSNSYPQQLSTRPYFLGSYPGLEFGASISYRNLSDVQNEYPTESIRDELVLTQLFIKKSLIHRLELSFSTTLSSFGTTQASGFGGMLSWHPLKLDQFYILPMFAIYTNYTNYEDSLTVQETGGQISLGKNLEYISLKAGLSFAQLSTSFSGINNGRQLTDTGNTEKESVFLQTYFASINTQFGKYLFTLTQNYSFESGWNPSFIISYQL